MDYGEVISSAWKIAWKHKALWLFGILASCGSSSGSSNSGASWQVSASPEMELPVLTDLQLSLIIGLGAVLIVVLICLAVFLSTIGRIGVTLGTVEADQGAESLTVGGVFRGSTPYFWRVFFLNLLIVIGVVILALFFGTVLVGLSIVTLGIALLCMIPLLCVLVPLGWLFYVYIEQANVALVVEDLSISDALQRGWQVFRENIGPLVLIGLFIAAVAFLVSLVLFLPFAFTVFPLLGSIFMGGELATLFYISLLCFVLYLPILLILNGILRTYLGSVWTLTFMRLTSGVKV